MCAINNVIMLNNVSPVCLYPFVKLHLQNSLGYSRCQEMLFSKFCISLFLAPQGDTGWHYKIQNFLSLLFSFSDLTILLLKDLSVSMN